MEQGKRRSKRRLLVPGHAFYPDFTLNGGRRLIEVVGFAADWYWDKTAEKVKLIVDSDNLIQVGIVTPFLAMMKRRLRNVPKIAFFTPYQLERLTDWCRGMPGFTSL